MASYFGYGGNKAARPSNNDSLTDLLHTPQLRKDFVIIVAVCSDAMRMCQGYPLNSVTYSIMMQGET